MNSTDSSLQSRVTITNQRGLHARAAAKFVKLAAEYACEIRVKRCERSDLSCAGEEVSGRSIMGLMMLAASPGTQLLITVLGVDAAINHTALKAIEKLVGDKFGEE